MPDEAEVERRTRFGEQAKEAADELAKSVPDEPDVQTQEGLRKEQLEGQKAKTAAIRADEAQGMLLDVLTAQVDRLIETESTLTQHVGQLLGDKDALNAQLLEKTGDLARIKQAHKSVRFSLGLSSLAFAVGGTLVSQFAASSSTEWAYFGWGLVGVASTFVLVKVILDA